ncbi:General secretion pathway protein J [Rhizobium sp. CF080]|nr:General secretion pathway protein J [Rhizobium sp. CF080]
MPQMAKRKTPVRDNAALPKDGFTLVEMLVTLCITALLSGLMMASIGQLRPMHNITRVNDAEMELEAASAYLQALLGQARRLAPIKDDPAKKAVFSGDATRFNLVAVAMVGNHRSSLRDVEIAVRQSADGFELIQRNVPRRLLSATQSEEFTIIAALKSVKFAYLTSPELSALPWVDVWTDREALPSAVKMSLVAIRSGQETAIERIAIIDIGR